MAPGPPRLPRIKLPANPLEPLREIVRGGRERIENAGSDIRSVADELHGAIPDMTSTIHGTEKVPEIEPQSPTAGSTTGTACLPCSRDHLSVTSSSLSEGIRFAREKGVKNPEVIRRIRIALDELNVMERIDLAPDETASLKGAEKDLADWTLKNSRDLRHAITAIKDVQTMEQAAAMASQITEEFMSRLWEIPEEECETCGEVREKLKEFIEKRKREVGSVHQRSPG